jgi:hypothetical protein
MWVLRSPENRTKIDNEKTAFLHAAKQAEAQGKMLKVPDWNSARVGDVVVDRALKTVYIIAQDGSRRRCDVPEARDNAINFVKQMLEQVRLNADSRNPLLLSGQPSGQPGPENVSQPAPAA